MIERGYIIRSIKTYNDYLCGLSSATLTTMFLPFTEASFNSSIAAFASSSFGISTKSYIKENNLDHEVILSESDVIGHQKVEIKVDGNKKSNDYIEKRYFIFRDNYK